MDTFTLTCVSDLEAMGRQAGHTSVALSLGPGDISGEGTQRSETMNDGTGATIV